PSNVRATTQRAGLSLPDALTILAVESTALHSPLWQLSRIQPVRYRARRNSHRNARISVGAAIRHLHHRDDRTDAGSCGHLRSIIDRKSTRLNSSHVAIS